MSAHGRGDAVHYLGNPAGVSRDRQAADLGAIAALDVVVMSDPAGAQIVYEPAPLIRTGVLDRHPEIGPALDRVFSGLDLATLRRLNAQVAVDGDTPEAVARRYLGSLPS